MFNKFINKLPFIIILILIFNACGYKAPPKYKPTKDKLSQIQNKGK